MSGPRIVIAAGGTAGHVVPAIAVADALRAEGAEVSFVGGQRAEAELVPAAGYPLDPIRVEGISRTNPLAAAARDRQGGAGAARRAARSCAGAGPTPCWAAAATSPGRSASRRCCARVPLVLTEADSHMGLTNRLLAAARRPRLPRVPDRRPRGRQLPGHRPPGAATRVADRADGARRARASAPSERCVLVFGGSLGARSVNQAAVGRVRRRARTASCTSPGGATSPDLRAPGPHYDLRDYLGAVRPGARGGRPGRRPRGRLDLRARPVRRSRPS